MSSIGTCSHAIPFQPRPSNSSDLVFLILSSKTQSLETTEEIWLYDLDNFTSDVGAYMGLLLGASLMSVYDLAKRALLAGARRKGCKK